MSFGNRRLWIFLALIGAMAFLALVPSEAQAQAGTMPFASGMCRLAQILSGPIVRYAAVILVAIGGIIIFAGEAGGLVGLLLRWLLGLSIAVGSISWVGWWTGATVNLAC